MGSPLSFPTLLVSGSSISMDTRRDGRRLVRRPFSKVALVLRIRLNFGSNTEAHQNRKSAANHHFNNISEKHLPLWLYYLGITDSFCSLPHRVVLLNVVCILFVDIFREICESQMLILPPRPKAHFDSFNKFACISFLKT